MKYKQDNRNPYAGQMLLYNNQRRHAGLPTHRKKDRRPRYFTRCEASETVDAFINYCNHTEDWR